MDPTAQVVTRDDPRTGRAAPVRQLPAPASVPVRRIGAAYRTHSQARHIEPAGVGGGVGGPGAPLRPHVGR